MMSAFKSSMVTFRIPTSGVAIDSNSFLNEISSKVSEVLCEQLDFHQSGVKVNFGLFGEYLQPTSGERSVKSHLTKAVIINTPNDIQGVYEECCSKMKTKAQEFKEKDSGKLLANNINNLELILFILLQGGLFNPGFGWS